MRMSLLVAALVLAAASVSAAQGATGARVRVSSLSPLVVQGSKFKTGERVSVSLFGAAERRRVVTADADGRFTMRFAIRLAACDAITVQAFGSKGSRARTLPARTTCDGAGTT